MSHFEFLDKRDENNSFIRFKVPELNFLISESIFQSISKYQSFKILEKNFSSTYLNMFFKKKFYLETTNLASKIIINRWNFKNDKKNFSNKIYLESCPYHHLIVDLFEAEPFLLLKKKKLRISTLIKSQKWVLYFYFLRLVNYFFKRFKSNKNIKDNETKIGVNYVEGHFSEFRNDLFWLSNKINKNSIIYYCENNQRLKKFSVDKKEIREIKKSNINFIKLWKWYNIEKVDFIENIKKEINLLKPRDNLEKWLIKEINIFLLQINFWYCFFKDQNIKIHFNSDEYSLSNVVRQIALNKLGGCSIGKCRSTPRKIKGDWFAYYPNDIFFVWGKDSIEGLVKSKNYFRNLIISGYPYKDNEDKLGEVFKIKKNFDDKGVKFSILVIDGSHSRNKDYLNQLIPSSLMSTYLKSFLKWVLEDEELGLIIKSKKPSLFENLTEVKQYLKKALKTGRCIVVDRAGLEPKKFSDIVNYSIGTSVDPPSSVIQIAIKGRKGIIYDFSNFKNFEKNLYNWGENRVIFSDLEKLIKKLKKFKSNNIKNDLGDWSSKIGEYDSFCDQKGGERIEQFVSDLKFYFDKGYSLNETIKHSNLNYAKNWGKDKIIRT